MLNGQVFSNQLFESHIFALFVNTFLGGVNGIAENYKNGMAVTYSGSNISIDTGAVVIQGRYLEEDTGTIINAGIDTLYCKLVIEIDLDKINSQNDFRQGYYSILTNQNNYPTLTQTDIVDNVSGVYQFELAQFRTTPSGITDFIDKRSFIDIEGLYEELETRYASELTTLNDHLTWKKITQFVNLNSQDTVTVDNLSNYKEIMISVGDTPYPDRILASSIIPIDVLTSSIRDSGFGFHQVLYMIENGNPFQAGISYLGNNQLKLYTGARGTLTVYAR